MKLEDGDAEFTVPSSLSPVIPAKNSFSASLPLPAVVSAGITWHTTKSLDIGFEFDWVGWSAYKSLAFDFTNNTPAVEDTDSPRNYKDSWNVHLGGEYRLEKLWQFRAGVYYDKTPVQVGYMTPETPDSNRLGLTAGVGLSIGNHVQLDLSFLYVSGMEREQTVQDAIDAGTLNPEAGTRDVLPGTYRLNAFIPGLSFAYKF
jgi:long-chain fatty acid transport protein